MRPNIDPAEVMEKTFPQVTEKHVVDYQKATRSLSKTINPAFPTAFRDLEFIWLAKSNVDMHNLLHTDQEYEHIAPIKVGAPLKVVTRISSIREKRGMLFVELISDHFSGGELAVVARASFVLRGVDPA